MTRVNDKIKSAKFDPEGTRHRRTEAVIVTISCSIAAAIFLFSDATDLGDSNTFLIFAHAISEGIANAGVYFRTYGYPIAIYLTGYVTTNSLIGILLVQAIAAALIPWFIYNIFAYIGTRTAFAAALLSIATVLPFNYQVLIYPDQLQLTCMFGFCWLLVAFCHEGSPRKLTYLFGVFAFVSLLRPTYLLFYGLILIAALFAMVRNGKADVSNRPLIASILILTGVFISVYGAVEAFDRKSYQKLNREKPTMAGRQVFWNVYLQSNEIEGAFQHGESTELLRAQLAQTLRAAPPNFDIRDLRPIDDARYQQLFAPYRADPEKLVAALFNNPDARNFWILFLLSDMALGNRGDRLFLKSALEQVFLHPQILSRIVIRGATGFLGGYPCVGDRETYSAFTCGHLEQ